MIKLKTQDDIALLRENALMVSKTLAEVGRHIAPGITTMELDRIADKYIRSLGAEPGFLGYDGYPYTLCISVNDTVVHGFPSEYKLKEGDIVSVDCGTKYRGFYGDSAYTFPVGKVSDEDRALLEATKMSLYKGIGKAVAGGRVGDIGQAVQSYVEDLLCRSRDGRTRHRAKYAREPVSSELWPSGPWGQAPGRYGHLHRADDQCRTEGDLSRRQRLGHPYGRRQQVGSLRADGCHPSSGAGSLVNI